MNEGRTVFSQLMDFLPLHQFRHCVERYGGNYKIQSFTPILEGFSNFSDEFPTVEQCIQLSLFDLQ